MNKHPLFNYFSRNKSLGHSLNLAFKSIANDLVLTRINDAPFDSIEVISSELSEKSRKKFKNFKKS